MIPDEKALRFHERYGGEPTTLDADEVPTKAELMAIGKPTHMIFNDGEEAEVLQPNIGPMSDMLNFVGIKTERMPGRTKHFKDQRPDLIIVDDLEEENIIDTTATEVPKELTHDEHA